jgi:hypothetical protein
LIKENNKQENKKEKGKEMVNQEWVTHFAGHVFQ